ncbi:hypothetical protein ABZ078_36825 [Streptomyces sp. NPDC006385]|uniref:hypothetical protein n=1 Tax=Streptomyces sp. NPDC006385 TaxID=3156761 RepID=UPI00339EDB62
MSGVLRDSSFWRRLSNPLESTLRSSTDAPERSRPNTSSYRVTTQNPKGCG